MTRFFTPVQLLCALSVWVGTSVQAVEPVRSKSVDAGLQVREAATEKELGLPLYPGARPQGDDNEDKGAVSLGLWGGPFGVSIAVRKLRSSDPMAQVVAFYRQQLAVHGIVLECTPGRPAAPEAEGRAASTLRCDKGPTQAGSLILKVGTPRNQRVVALQPQGREVHFQLVRIEVKGD